MHIIQTTHDRNEAEPLAHERLDAYRVAIEFCELATTITKQLPRTKGQLGDQLARASESVVLRIAEGAGAEFRSADQRRYFRSARGSALESSAALDLCRIRGVGSPAQLQQGRCLVLRIVQMLTRLAEAR